MDFLCRCAVFRGLGNHQGSSVTHTWRGRGVWLSSWTRVPANGSVGRHTHTHTHTDTLRHIQKSHCVSWGEAERCNRARSGCGWQTDWQAGRHDDPLSWRESVNVRHGLHHPRLSVCSSPCLFPLSHRLFLPSLALRLAPSFHSVTCCSSDFLARARKPVNDCYFPFSASCGNKSWSVFSVKGQVEYQLYFCKRTSCITWPDFGRGDSLASYYCVSDFHVGGLTLTIP